MHKEHQGRQVQVRLCIVPQHLDTLRLQADALAERNIAEVERRDFRRGIPSTHITSVFHASEKYYSVILFIICEVKKIVLRHCLILKNNVRLFFKFRMPHFLRLRLHRPRNKKTWRLALRSHFFRKITKDSSVTSIHTLSIFDVLPSFFHFSNFRVNPVLLRCMLSSLL